MVEREADICEIEQEDGTLKHLSAVTILNERGEYSNCLGVMPTYWRPFARYVDPWFSRGHISVKNLAGMARARVNARLKSGAGDRKDLLARLQEARDENGNPMDIDELTAEALTQLIAVSYLQIALLAWRLKYLVVVVADLHMLYFGLNDVYRAPILPPTLPAPSFSI